MRLIEFFDRGCAIAPAEPALRGEGGSYTYTEVSQWTHALAISLRRHGANETTRIAILTPNDTRGLICLLGIHRLGGVYVRLNARATLEENIHILRRSGATWLFFHSSLSESLPALRRGAPALEHLVCMDRPHSEYPHLEAFVEGSQGSAERLGHDPFHVAMLASTGGTTGVPKLVMLTDLNFESAVAAQLASMPCRGRPVYLIASLMTHAATTIAYGMLAQGATIIILPKAEPLEIMRTIGQRRVTHLYLPPTVIYMMLDRAEVGSFDYSSLQSFIYGAAPISAARLEEAIRTFGPVMTQCYGQAECPMFISVLTPDDHRVPDESARAKRLRSCGRPSHFCSVAIMDDAGRLLPPGERGEIVVRGNLVMKGYYEDEEATREAGKHGWHHTGDIGYLDEDGLLFIVDRKKDLIISGGFNIYPGEIEQTLSSHEAVLECAVVGVPHDKWGEQVLAIVQLKERASVSSADLVDFCRERLGGIKAPKAVEIWPTLPRTPAGKVMKNEIRSRYWQGRERVI